MKPGRKRSKKVKVSRVKLQKQILAAESKARTIEKYYKCRLDEKDQAHKEKVEQLKNYHKSQANLKDLEHKSQMTQMAVAVAQLKEDKEWMHKIIVEYQDQKKQLETDNKLLYQMLEKKPTLLEKIKQKLSK